MRSGLPTCAGDVADIVAAHHGAVHSKPQVEVAFFESSRKGPRPKARALACHVQNVFSSSSLSKPDDAGANLQDVEHGWLAFEVVGPLYIGGTKYAE